MQIIVLCLFFSVQAEMLRIILAYSNFFIALLSFTDLIINFVNLNQEKALGQFYQFKASA